MIKQTTIKYIFSIVISCIILCSGSKQVFCEDEQKNLIFGITDLSGGLNTKTSQFSLKPNQGDICQNMRFNEELGSITKRDNLNVYGTADVTEPILGMHRFYMKDDTKALLVNSGNDIYKGTDSTGAFTSILTLTTGDQRWQWLTWHNLAIGTDGYNQPVKYDGTSVSATYLGSCLATDAGSGAGPDGTYSYKISFYTASYEVLFNVASNTVVVADNDIDLTMIPIAPTSYGGEDIVGRKIYRTTDGSSSYALLSNGTIANNTAVILTDSDADIALGVAYPAGDATYKPPLAKFSVMHNGRLWFANDPDNNPSRAFYSDSENHDIFEDDSYWDVRQNDGDELTFIKQVLGILAMGKNNSISKLYTDGLDTEWTLSDPFTFIGCQAPYSVSQYIRGLVYLAIDGIYVFNGQYTQLISDVVSPDIDGISSSDFEHAWGIFHRNMYYLAYAAEETSVAHNDRVLVFDLLSNAYSIDLLNINCFTAFNSGDDWGTLYGGGSDTGKVYSFEKTDNRILHRRHDDFVGLWDDMRYIPESIGGDSQSPVLEIARTETIDELTGTIDALVGSIDRQDKQGDYVSQVMAIDAISFDKLYWHETIPLTGGDVTIKLRTSSVNEQNLILNDCFEFWDNAPAINIINAPNDWTAASTSTTVIACQSDTTTIYGNIYSARVNTEATITQVLLNGTNYQGKTLVFDAWTNCASTIADKAYIEIDDGISTARAYRHSLVTGWENTATTLAINATATSITLRCALLSNADAPAYFDKVMCLEASSATNNWTDWSSAYTNPTGSDISGETMNSYLQYLIEMNTYNESYTPNILERDGYAIKLTYNKEGVAQTNNIPMEWRSGWLDFNKPMYTKVLRQIIVYHEGTEGELTITFENFDGDTDEFVIDLAQYPNRYREYFTTGAFTGRFFRITVDNDDDNELKIRRLEIIYDCNPIY